MRRPALASFAPRDDVGEGPVVTALERVGPSDFAELEWESPDAPMHIVAVLRLADEIDEADLRTVLGRRVAGVPRLRQRLVMPSGLARRAWWTEDPDFTIERHMTVIACPPPADEKSLLELAAREGNRVLSRDRPLWRVILVTGLRDGAAVIIVVHHAVADGIGGLAVLTELMDPPSRSGEAPRSRSGSPHPGPIDTQRVGPKDRRWHPSRPQRSSINQPIGPRRHLAVAETSLAPVVLTARRHGATVNDLLLVAAVDALHTALAAEGENVSSLTVSVPVSRRSTTTATNLGNEVGVMPVSVPCEGPMLDRLRHVAATTQRRRAAGHPGQRDVPGRWLGPAMGVLARLGLFQWFIRRQHLVNTFLTNVRGPTHELSLLGVPVVAVTPASPIAGNVTVAFTAFSYAGALSVTVVADADRWPDAAPLAAAFNEALDALLHDA